MSAKGFASDTGVSLDDAHEFIEMYFSEFPDVLVWIDRVQAGVLDTGVVTTLFGRKRLLPHARSDNPHESDAALREAINMPIQSAASDLVQYATLAVHKQLARHPAWQARIILSVHDEVLVECREEHSSDVGALLSDTMPKTVADVLGDRAVIPFPVDVAIQKRWSKE